MIIHHYIHASTPENQDAGCLELMHTPSTPVAPGQLAQAAFDWSDLAALDPDREGLATRTASYLRNGPCRSLMCLANMSSARLVAHACGSII